MATPGPPPSPPPPPFMDQQYAVTDNQVLDALYINMIWGGLCLIGFVVLRSWLRGPGGVFQRRQELQDLFMRPPKLVVGTVKQIWNWLMPLLAVSDADIIRCSGFDGLIITRVLLIGLQMFTVMTLLGMAVLIPVYATNGGLNRSDAATGTLAKISLANVPSGSMVFVLPFLMLYVFTAYGCWVLWINCKCYTQLRLAYFMCLDALPTEAAIHHAGIEEDLQARVVAMMSAQRPQGSQEPGEKRAGDPVGGGTVSEAVAASGGLAGLSDGGPMVAAAALNAAAAGAEHAAEGGAAAVAPGREALGAVAPLPVGALATTLGAAALASSPAVTAAAPALAAGTACGSRARANAAAALPAAVEMSPLAGKGQGQGHDPPHPAAGAAVPAPSSRGPGAGPPAAQVSGWSGLDDAASAPTHVAVALSEDLLPPPPAMPSGPGPLGEAVEGEAGGTCRGVEEEGGESRARLSNPAPTAAPTAASTCGALELDEEWHVPEMQLRSTWLNAANFANPTLRMMLDYLDWMSPLQRMTATFGARRLTLPCLTRDEVPEDVRQYGSKDDMIAYDNWANRMVRGDEGDSADMGDAEFAGVGDAPVAVDDRLPAVLPYWRPLAMLKYLRRRYKHSDISDQPQYGKPPDGHCRRSVVNDPSSVASTFQDRRMLQESGTAQLRAASLISAASRSNLYELCHLSKTATAPLRPAAAKEAVSAPSVATAAPRPPPAPPVWGDTPLPSRIADPLQPLLPGKRNARLLQLLKVPMQLRGAKAVAAAGGDGDGGGHVAATSGDCDGNEPVVRLVNVRHYVVLIKGVHVKRGPDWLDRMAAMTFVFVSSIRKGTMKTARTATRYAAVAMNQMRRGYETGMRSTSAAAAAGPPHVKRMSASRSPSAVRRASGGPATAVDAAATQRLDPTVRRYFEMFNDTMETHLVAPSKQGGGIKTGAVAKFMRLAGWTARNGAPRMEHAAAAGGPTQAGHALNPSGRHAAGASEPGGQGVEALAKAGAAPGPATRLGADDDDKSGAAALGDEEGAAGRGEAPAEAFFRAASNDKALSRSASVGEPLSRAASAGEMSLGAADLTVGIEDANGAAVADVLRDLFPDSFLGLVPVSNSDPVDALIYKWDRKMLALDAVVRDLKISEARLQAAGCTDVEALASAAYGAKASAGAGAGVARGKTGAADAGAEAGWWRCCCRWRDIREREAARLGRLRERISKLRGEILDLELEIQEVRLQAHAAPLGTAFFAIFDNAQDAQTLGQSRRVVPPQGPGYLVSFDAVPAPAPDDICWSALWSTTWWSQALRRLAIVMPMAIIFAIPIGPLQGALSNLDVAICSKGAENNKLFVAWFCDKTGFWSRLLTSLLTGVLPSILGLVWSSFCMPQLLYFCSSVSRRAWSLSAQEREMQTWFFWYSVFNTFLGAVLGGGVFSQLGTYLSDPRALLDRIGKTLPSTANFFIQYCIARAVFTNVLRLLWPHAGAMLTSLFRSLLRLGRPRSLHAAAWIHQVPSARATGYYIGILQVFMFGCAFAVVAPIILPCCWFFFFTGFFAYRYSILYVYERNYESGGRMWPVVFNQIMGFLLLMEIFGGAVFIVNKAYILSLVTWFSLTPSLGMFWRHCRHAYLDPLHHPPLSLAAREPAGVRVDPLIYMPPALRPGAIGWYPEQGKVWEKYGIPKHWW